MACSGAYVRTSHAGERARGCAGSLTLSRRAIARCLGICARTACTDGRFGKASARARMNPGFRGEEPLIPGSGQRPHSSRISCHRRAFPRGDSEEDIEQVRAGLQAVDWDPVHRELQQDRLVHSVAHASILAPGHQFGDPVLDPRVRAKGDLFLRQGCGSLRCSCTGARRPPPGPPCILSLGRHLRALFEPPPHIPLIARVAEPARPRPSTSPARAGRGSHRPTDVVTLRIADGSITAGNGRTFACSRSTAAP